MADQRRYHHGDLPNALRAAAVELIGEVGPMGFSLREVARRAGVSHAAPAHHFGDRAGLLEAVIDEGFELLTAALGADEVVGHVDALDRLLAQGRAYLGMAREHPAHFSVMFRKDLCDDGAVFESGLQAYATLIDSMELIRKQYSPDLDVDDAAMTVWSMVHGLAELSAAMNDADKFTAGRSEPIADIDELLARMTSLIIGGLAPGAR